MERVCLSCRRYLRFGEYSVTGRRINNAKKEKYYIKLNYIKDFLKQMPRIADLNRPKTPKCENNANYDRSPIHVGL